MIGKQKNESQSKFQKIPKLRFNKVATGQRALLNLGFSIYRDIQKMNGGFGYSICILCHNILSCM